MSSAKAAARIIQNSHWGKPCQALFADLATFSPDDLVTVFEYGDLNRVDTAYAAEYVGEGCGLDTTKRLLIPLLSHPAGFVREGTIYGLEYHIQDPEIQEALSTAASQETSSILQGIFRAALKRTEPRVSRFDTTEEDQ